MIENAAIAAIVTGVFAILGGIQGFVRAKSRPSLIAGLILGDALLFGGVFALVGWEWGLWIAGGAALLLIGRFLPAYLKVPKKVWPALIMAFLSGVTITLVLVALL